MFHILSAFTSGTPCWKRALLEAIPPRKGAKPLEEENDEDSPEDTASETIIGGTVDEAE